MCPNKEILFEINAHRFHSPEITFQICTKVRMTHDNICRCKHYRDKNASFDLRTRA